VHCPKVETKKKNGEAFDVGAHQSQKICEYLHAIQQWECAKLVEAIYYLIG